jgi:hypothetical protein
LIVLVIVVAGGWIYWQLHKKAIIRNSIENAVKNGTDSLYFIHYDSSYVDEINGNASFYNVELQSDSLQRQLTLFDTASSATVYNIHVDEVTVLGADIPALLSNTAVDARSIQLKHPVVYIISSGKKEEHAWNVRDTLAIYEKLLGKFNSIHSGEIVIEHGFLNFADKTGEPHTALKDISIVIKNFRIDSTKDYDNIISYFIKDVVAKVKEIVVKGDKNTASFSDVEYNAPGKFLFLKKFQQRNSDNQLVFDVNGTSINNIATDSFILKQQLKAEELRSDGGMLTFFRKPAKAANEDNDQLEIDNNYFDEAQLNKITIGNTKVMVYNKAKPAAPPFVLNNVKFSAFDIQKLYSGTNIKNLISRSNWILSADGFSFLTENKRYKMNVGAFSINNALSTLSVNSFSVVPQLSEEAFSRSIKYQDDLYNLDFKNIELSGVNTKLLITDKRIEAETMTIQPVIKVFDDRTVTPNPASKVGKYPHQLLQKVKFPVNIKKMIVKNGYVAYKERGAISRKTGVVFFKNVNGIITNVTNAKDVISKNNMMVVNATASFMGVSDMQTTWQLPLNSGNGAFRVTGNAGKFNGEVLNPMSEPLGMVTIRKGIFNKITFDLTGNDLMAKGSSLFLYDDLKIDLLKKDDKDSTVNEKKGVTSFVANMFARNKNPQNGETRKNDVYMDRDITKSWFYLIWKSIFAAAKKTVQGKNTD